MRKLLIILTLSTITAHFSQAKAQEVYDMVLQSATRIVNNPASNFTVTRVAQFKRTALLYMRDMVIKNAPDTTALFLDTQAYNLNEFTTEFFSTLLRNQGNMRKEVINIFMKASSDNPIWNDTDKETAESFIIAGELTPFSLDTDWEKAYKQADEQLKQKSLKISEKEKRGK